MTCPNKLPKSQVRLQSKSPTERKREFAELRRRRRDESKSRRLRRSWLGVLQAEFSMLSSWRFEASVRQGREDFEERNLRRFEAQWQRYAAGLENFARSHALDSKNRDQWVATVSDGKVVWLNERTGQTRPSDPLEARVRGTLARERKTQGCTGCCFQLACLLVCKARRTLTHFNSRQSKTRRC